MASLINNDDVDFILLDGDTIIVDHPSDASFASEASSSQSSALLSDPPASSTPSTPSLIETIPLRRFSWIWNQMLDTDPQTIYLDSKGNRQWRCQHCSRKYMESGGTRIITHHLKNAHHITEKSAGEEQRERVVRSIELAMENARVSTGFKRRRIAETDRIDDGSDTKRCKSDFRLPGYVSSYTNYRLMP